MQTLFYDLRYALRQLGKAPGLALLAILTLALGVGANTAIFTVIESVLLRSLPYAHSDRLVYIGPKGDKPGFATTSWLNYRDIRDQSKLLSAAAGYSEDVGVLETRDGSQSVVAPRVTTNLFSMLGVKPMLGRTFTESDGLAGGPQVVDMTGLKGNYEVALDFGIADLMLMIRERAKEMGASTEVLRLSK